MTAVEPDAKAAEPIAAPDDLLHLCAQIARQHAVAVQKEQHLTAGVTGALVHLAGASFGTVHHRIARRNFFGGAVGAAAVGKDDLPVAGQPLQLRKEAVDLLRLVEHRHDQR